MYIFYTKETDLCSFVGPNSKKPGHLTKIGFLAVIVVWKGFDFCLLGVILKETGIAIKRD